MAKAKHHQYLSRYAEPESRQLPAIHAQWDHVVVVPACDEGDDLFALLQSVRRAAGDTRALTIIVVNGREDVASQVHQQNTRCLKRLAEQYPAEEFHPGMWMHSSAAQDLLWIDRATPNRYLPPRQGVGLARKIGCDVAAALHAQNPIRSGWLTSTDADAILPPDAFTRLPPAADVSAVTFPFQHQLEPPHDEAMALYELSLHHYVLGLEHARSPYAFHTIGSALGFSIDAYIAVRGFPKRQAGEDFYLLNKLAKVGRIERRNGRPISLRGRPSERVPFGTGPAIRKIHQEDTHSMYHPAIFDELRILLQTLRAFGDHGNIQILKAANSSASWGGLIELGFEPLLVRLGSLPPKQRHHQIHGWFDGFKTMKWIHHRRDTSWPSLPWRECVEAAPWFEKLSQTSDPKQALRLARTTLRAMRTKNPYPSKPRSSSMSAYQGQ